MEKKYTLAKINRRAYPLSLRKYHSSERWDTSLVLSKRSPSSKIKSEKLPSTRISIPKIALTPQIPKLSIKNFLKRPKCFQPRHYTIKNRPKPILTPQKLPKISSPPVSLLTKQTPDDPALTYGLKIFKLKELIEDPFLHADTMTLVKEMRILKEKLWPILVVSQTEKSIMIELRFRRLFLLGGLFVHFVLGIFILSACNDLYDCESFLPTISYIAAQPMYDRVFCWLLMVAGSLLGFFHLSCFMYFDMVLGRLDSLVLLGMGIIEALGVPFLGIVDEVNGSGFISLEKVHLILMVGIVSLSVIWIGFSLNCYWRIYFSKPKKLARVKYLVVYLVLTFYVCWMMYKNWKHISYDKNRYSHDEAISEFVAVSFLIYLPYIYSLTFKTLNVEVTTRLMSKGFSVLS